MRVRTAVLGLCLLGAMPALSQEHAEHAAAKMESSAQGIRDAVAVLHPLGESKVSGTVRFLEKEDGVQVTADIKGLPPNSTHGFHIHEFGDCSAPDGASAGGHYNPEGHQHAGPDAQQRHAGDLGNVKSDDEGAAKLDVMLNGVTIAGAKNPIVGRSVVLHQKADDLKTQPSGDSGARIACGVIGIAKPK